ncbi:unnamed protein product [Camellia sinensis]
MPSFRSATNADARLSTKILARAKKQFHKAHSSARSLARVTHFHLPRKGASGKRPEDSQSSLERKNPRSSEEAHTQVSLERKKPRSSEEAKTWAAIICTNSLPTCSKLTQRDPQLNFKELKRGNKIKTATSNHGIRVRNTTKVRIKPGSL